ncbi:MAG: hypothetical protein WKG32_22330 [Gemmatimonadaceae bacterium]
MHRPSLPSAILAALLLAGATGLAAQARTLPSLEPGARVRVTAPSLSRGLRVGTVAGVRGDSLDLKVAGRDTTVTVSASELTRLEVSRGQRRQGRKGMGMGLLIGAAGGAVLGYASGDDESGFIAFSAGEKAVLSGVVFGVLGTVIGGLAGLSSQTDRWVSLPLDGGPTTRARLSLDLSHVGSRRLGLSVSF